MATYQELISQQAALEKQAAELREQIDNARRTEHASVLAQIRTLMADHGITAAELGAGRGGRTAKPASTAGRKVAAKYRDAATGNSWSGRGLQPNWLKSALASGRKIEDFAI